MSVEIPMSHCETLMLHRETSMSHCETLRPPQTRKHCCGDIVARNFPTASKRVGSKTNVLLPCRANQETFHGHLLRTQNVSEKIQKHFLCPQQMLRARANRETFASATMFPQQCFLVCGGL